MGSGHPRSPTRCYHVHSPGASPIQNLPLRETGRTVLFHFLHSSSKYPPPRIRYTSDLTHYCTSLYSEETIKYHMILKFIYLAFSAVKNIPIAPYSRLFFYPFQAVQCNLIYVTALSQTQLWCSYDHFNCSLSYNQVNFKRLSFSQLLFA